MLMSCLIKQSLTPTLTIFLHSQFISGRTVAPREIRVGGPSSRAIYSSPAITGRVICLFYIMLNPGVFLERPSHAFWFEPCGTLII